MPKEYSVDDILNEVLGNKANSKPQAEAPKQANTANMFVTAMPEDSAEFEIPVAKKREETPVIDSTDAPTILHTPEPEKTPEKPVVSEEVKAFVKNEIFEQAKKETVHFPIDIGDEYGDDEEEDDENEFSNYGQKKEFSQKFSLEKANATVRVIVSAVCATVLVVLGVWQFFSSGENAFFSPIDPVSTGVYICATALIMTIFSAAICYPTTLGGIKKLFTFNANTDSLPAIFCVVTAVSCVAALVSPTAAMVATAITTACVCLLTMFFNSLGKMLKISNDKKNFEILSEKTNEKSVCEVISDANLSFELTSGLGISDPVITAGHRANFLNKFVKNSTEETVSDKNMRFLAPVVFFGSIVVGLITFILGDGSISTSLQALCAAMCLATPMSSALCCVLPLNRANRELRKNGGFITGLNCIEDVADTNLVYLDSSELFTTDTIHLYVLRTLGDFKIDDCIVDAASITAEAQIPLCNVFLNMVLGDKKLLRKVDSLIYEDDMGLSAWVGGKRVLLGNRELLKTHGIEPPTREFEAKFKIDGREIVYLVNSGEIAAFFVVGYNADEEVADMVQTLCDNRIAMLVRNSDSNLTVKKLSYIFDIDMEDIAIVPKTLQNQCDKYTEETMSSPACAVYSKGTKGFVKTLLAAIKVKNAISLASLLQLGSVILGYAIVCFFAFVSGISQVTLPAILIYQLFWLAAIALLPNLTRYK